MIPSRAWNWDTVKDDAWSIPSEDVYYYLERWSKLGYKRLLDLGCGLGRHSIFFAKNGFAVDAFDLSVNGLEKLKEQTRQQKLNIHIKLGDMLVLPYDDGSFDCILAYHSIYHTDSSGIERVLSEIKRVLTKDGEAFLTFNSKSNPSFIQNSPGRIDENTVLKTEGYEMDIPHYYADADELKALLKDFQIIKMRQIEDIDETKSHWHYFVTIKKSTMDE
ncbi:MAG TPA: class I SAM-dependent methyltransferase [Firmicutes bacterium]|jgi:SAM-dependent methyltransferase|nr:class I SAM-dependent methyltransferase [Bacillota bacterium]